MRRRCLWRYLAVLLIALSTGWALAQRFPSRRPPPRAHRVTPSNDFRRGARFAIILAAMDFDRPLESAEGVRESRCDCAGEPSPDRNEKHKTGRRRKQTEVRPPA